MEVNNFGERRRRRRRMVNMFRLSHGMRSAEGDEGEEKRLLMKRSKRDLWALPAYIISLSGAEVARAQRWTRAQGGNCFNYGIKSLLGPRTPFRIETQSRLLERWRNGD